nr:unnamed protein product [Callosobruchus chinensis]
MQSRDGTFDSLVTRP